MSESTTKFKKGDTITSKDWGEGTVVSVETVELPSDNDHVLYRVAMNDGVVRNLKAAELKTSKAS